MGIAKLEAVNFGSCDAEAAALLGVDGGERITLSDVKWGRETLIEAGRYVLVVNSRATTRGELVIELGVAGRFDVLVKFDSPG